MPGTTRRCPHCGAELAPRTVALMGRTVFAGWEECQCYGARRERGEAARAAAERERGEEAERMARAARRSGVMPRFERAEHPLAAQCAEDMARGRGLYIHGPVGTGKTCLASATALLLIAQGRRVRFTAMWRVLDAIKRGFRDGTDPLPALQSVGLLFLDDLGKESPTDFALERLFALVDERSARVLPTCVTTQYRPSELIARLAKNGDRDTAVAVVSRLRQQCRMVETSGPDRRMA